MDNRSFRPVLRYLRHLSGQDAPAASDHSLLDEFRSRRDEEAFAALMRRHGPLVLGVCRRVLHNEHDAEDVFQATFLVLAKKAGSIRQRDSLGSWLYKVAYRLALKLRARVVPAPVAELAAESGAQADEAGELSWREVRGLLDEELQKLPEKYRAPLVLCYLAGRTRDEAAEELGWSAGAVKGRLERGRELLRRRLAKRGLTLSVALMGTMLSQAEGAAAVPSAWIAATTQAALSSGTGAAVSAQVQHLVQFGIQVTGTSFVKAAALMLLALGIATAGAVLCLHLVGNSVVEGPASPSAPADEPPPAPAQGPPFRDITRQSGLQAILDDAYAAHPKWWLSGLHMVDLDGDGHLDLFLSAHGAGTAVAALNDGKGNFKAATGTYPTSEIHLAYDLDEDGRVDLATTFQDGGSKWWINKSRPGVLQFEPTKIERGTNTARRQAMIDINRDGRVDWIRGVPNVLTFDLADGKGGFTAAAGTLPVGDTLRSETLCLPVDLHGDGHIDFIVEWGHYSGSKGNSRIYRNDGKMNFKDVTEECGLPTKNFSIKGVADVNQDGFPDLIVLEDLKPEIYLNDGKGKFKKKPNAITGMEQATRPTMASWGIAVMTDFDNDGIPDILWNGKHFLWVLRGTGDGNFRYVNKEWGIKDLAASAVDDGHCFGDINGDGMLDLVGYTALGEQRRCAVYLNTLPKQNWVRVRPIGKPGNKGAAGAKVRLYAPGTDQLLWYEQVAIYNSQSAQSYYALAETERHYGLGRRGSVDVEIEFYPSGKKVRKTDVPANSTIKVNEETP